MKFGNSFCMRDGASCGPDYLGVFRETRYQLRIELFFYKINFGKVSQA